MYDLKGRMIDDLTARITNGEVHWKTASWSAETFFVRVKKNGLEVCEKVVPGL